MNKYILAIVAPSFAEPSETFVRSHVKTICPDGTVLLCEIGIGAEAFRLPVLSDLDPYPEPYGRAERILNALRFRWRDLVDQRMTGAGERRARAFMVRNSVTHCLAEFGPTGCRVSRATARAGVKLYVHFHGSDATVLPRRASWRRHYRILFSQASGIIAPSRYIADRLAVLGCPPDKLHISPCGIAPDEFPVTRREPGMVVAVGRMVEKKAPLLTIQSFCEAAQSHPYAHLHMVGDGPLFAAARALIYDRNLQNKVTLYGAVPHEMVRNLISRASLFVQHSVEASNGDTEGLPVSILEAMASGVAVVSTRHSGIPEAVSEGLTGVLVTEHDQVGMAAAIKHLLGRPDDAKALGLAARTDVRERFSHEAIAQNLRRIIGLN